MDDPKPYVGGLQAAALLEGLLQAHGGVRGIVEQLERSGLGETVRTWVGTGSNAPVTPAELEAALGPSTVARLAASAGVEPARAAEALARFLPLVVDRLTPGGVFPAPNEVQQDVASLIA